MAIQITNVTTKFGDQGDTSLSCGTKVPKFNPRVLFYGKLDSLNCLLGSLRTEIDALTQDQQAQLQHPQSLIQIQNDIFDLGASYSFEKSSEWQQDFPAQRTEGLEGVMEEWLVSLDPLQSFVLPGGTRANAYAHQARSMTREIEAWALQHRQELQLQASAITYLNRLSDALFVLARLCCKIEDQPEYLWQAGLGK